MSINRKLWSAAVVVSSIALSDMTSTRAETGGSLTPAVGETQSPISEPVSIDGYRSAHFGMTEAEVRKAIRTDFGADDAVKGTNDLERTGILVVPPKSLIPDVPPASISYIFGATGAKLIQVNIVWGEKGGVDAKQILPAANALVGYFMERGSYAKDSVLLNQALSDGAILLFRGSDAKGRMVTLLLLPIVDPVEAQKHDKDKPIEFKKAMLRLSYVANPAKPDIFRIEKGRF